MYGKRYKYAINGNAMESMVMLINIDSKFSDRFAGEKHIKEISYKIVNEKNSANGKIRVELINRLPNIIIGCKSFLKIIIANKFLNRYDKLIIK